MLTWLLAWRMFKTEIYINSEAKFVQSFITIPPYPTLFYYTGSLGWCVFMQRVCVCVCVCVADSQMQTAVLFPATHTLCCLSVVITLKYTNKNTFLHTSKHTHTHVHTHFNRVDVFLHTCVLWPSVVLCVLIASTSACNSEITNRCASVYTVKYTYRQSMKSNEFNHQRRILHHVPIFAFAPDLENISHMERIQVGEVFTVQCDYSCIQSTTPSVSQFPLSFIDLPFHITSSFIRCFPLHFNGEAVTFTVKYRL